MHTFMWGQDSFLAAESAFTYLCSSMPLADGLITDNVGSRQLSDCQAAPLLGLPAVFGNLKAAQAAAAAAGSTIAQQQDVLITQLLADGETMGNCSAFLRKW